jgi:Anaphase-promoting complex, subunit 10 (APC10)
MLPNLPEPDIGHLAKWSVSSYKFGFGAECLRDGDPDTFWQYVILAESCPLTKNYQVLMALSPISSR